MTRAVDLSVADCRWANWPVLIVDMEQRSHMHVDGLLGEDLLNEFSAIRIDFKNRIVEMEEQ